MSELRLVGEVIDWLKNLGQNFGHFQVVLAEDNGSQQEIEVEHGTHAWPSK
jgi:hypothetical protein